MCGPATILLIVTCGLVTPSLAVNFTACFDDIRRGMYGPNGGTNAHGQPVTNISTAVGITYALCKSACETGPEPMQWSIFVPKFSAWLLPWFALISQLPFGAGDRLENLTSVLLAVGSPMLAAYSLAITVLNCRWAAQRLSDIRYPNIHHAFRIMSSLQQAPLRIIKEDGLLESLVVLPENDAWWGDLADRLDYTQSWSISTGVSLMWVFLAYMFTVIDTFTSLPPNTKGPFFSSDGQAVGTVWLWLFGIVVGWLQISPKCESRRLQHALLHANSGAYVASNSGPQKINTDARAFTMYHASEDSALGDAKYSAPIFNYARVLPWTQNVEHMVAVFRCASRHARDHQRVDGQPQAHWVDGAEIQPQNRRGTLEQVISYCTSSFPEKRSHWGPGVWSRMLIASLIALLLQWGTAGAAIIIVYYTPTVGLGCRSGSYLLYAAASTLIWMLLVTSSILTHLLATPSLTGSANQEPDSDHDTIHFTQPWPRLQNFIRMLVIFLRRLGKVLATCNAIWIILVCTFQFSGFFSRCYCNSSAIGLGSGSGAYDVIIITANEVKGPWIGGVALALGSAFLFIGIVNLFINPVPTRSP
jgi:hypothetical protein